MAHGFLDDDRIQEIEEYLHDSGAQAGEPDASTAAFGATSASQPPSSARDVDARGCVAALPNDVQEAPAITLATKERGGERADAGVAAPVVHVCQNCAYVDIVHHGQCPGCRRWNFMRPQHRAPERGGFALPASEIHLDGEQRASTGSIEVDRVLGAGVVEGSVILFTGDPGSGKSTLLLQIAVYLAPALYVTAEETRAAVASRSVRLQLESGGLHILSAIDLDDVEREIKRLKPRVVVFDSVQTLRVRGCEAQTGSPTQVRAVGERICDIMKGRRTSTVGTPPFVALLVGHVTKDGSMAGPRTLEHAVDVAMMLEGDRNSGFRFLRAFKNRLGSTVETGVFEMAARGLVDVVNASARFLADRTSRGSGTVVTAACPDGASRAMLVEVQALASGSATGRNVVNGLDLQRVAMTLQVMRQKAAVELGDVLFNVVGGLSVTEPAADLAVAIAAASAFYDTAVPSDLVVFGEVGLAGELRAVSQPQIRLAEAATMGFTRALVPPLRNVASVDGIQLLRAETLQEAIDIALGR